MTSHDRSAFYPGISPEFRQYIAARISQRFRERQLSHLGVPIFNSVLFRELLSEAFGDAARDELIDDARQPVTRTAFMLDDNFYGEVCGQAGAIH